MTTIRAISLHQPWASLIASGRKTVETRGYPTRHRGDLLICSTQKPTGHGPTGVALAIVNVVGCRTMQPQDEQAARCAWEPGRWAWLLEDIRPIDRPFPVKGRQRFFTVQLPKEIERMARKKIVDNEAEEGQAQPAEEPTEAAGESQGQDETTGPQVTDDQAQELFIARQRVKEAQQAEDEAKEVYNSKKKVRETRQDELDELLDAIFSSPGPLFEQEQDRQAEPQAWRDLPTSELNLTDRIQGCLEEAELTTLGALSDRMAEGTLWALQVRGIGEASREKVEDAFQAFWEEHPQYCRQEPQDQDEVPAEQAEPEPEAAPEPQAAE